jgi:hypothetical protein
LLYGTLQLQKFSYKQTMDETEILFFKKWNLF